MKTTEKEKLTQEKSFWPEVTREKRFLLRGRRRGFALAASPWWGVLGESNAFLRGKGARKGLAGPP